MAEQSEFDSWHGSEIVLYRNVKVGCKAHPTGTRDSFPGINQIAHESHHSLPHPVLSLRMSRAYRCFSQMPSGVQRDNTTFLPVQGNETVLKMLLQKLWPWIMPKISTECIKLKCLTSKALISGNLRSSESLHGLGSCVPTIWYSVWSHLRGSRCPRGRLPKNVDWCLHWGQG